MSQPSTGPTLVLYSKPGCHLCEVAEAELVRLQRQWPHRLILVDITDDPDLVQRYGERIPVVVAATQEYAAPLGPAELEAALREATRAAAHADGQAEGHATR